MIQAAKKANRFCFAKHAMVTSSADGGWDALFMNGAARHLTDAELSRRGFAVDCRFGESGFYAILDSFREHSSFAYRVNPEAGLVWLENGGDPVPLHEFLLSAVRADADGHPVCSFLSDAEQQLYACASTGAEGHVSEIIGGATAGGACLVRDWIEAARIRSGAAGLDNYEILSMVA